MAHKLIGQVGGLQVVSHVVWIGGGLEVHIDLEYQGPGWTPHTLTLDEAAQLQGMLELAVIECLQAEEQEAVKLGYE